MRLRSLPIAPALLLLLPLLLGDGGCGATPTLPLPPPVASISSSMQGLVVVEGQVRSLAYVSVFNERTESGVITRADTEGYFAAEIEGLAGDTLNIWQEFDGETGERRQIVVPPLTE